MRFRDVNESKPHNIVRGQSISQNKVEFARQMRHKMSPVECRLWMRLRSNQIEGFHFRRQQVIAGYIADFYCHSAGLAIEIDGMTHDDPVYDARRDEVFASKGIKVMRFTNEQVVREIDGVLQAIWEYLTAYQTSP